MPCLDELWEAIKRSGLRVTFDPERNIAAPCWRCGDTKQPRDLVVVGHYINQHRDEMSRPLCPSCKAELRDGPIVLVCGGRDYADREKVFAVLDEVRPRVVIHGGATGTDSCARKWAISRGVEQKEYRADWTMNGRAAGPFRNQRMIAENHQPAEGKCIDLCVAFPGGRGTADCVRRARRAGIEVREIVSDRRDL